MKLWQHVISTTARHRHAISTIATCTVGLGLAGLALEGSTSADFHAEPTKHLALACIPLMTYVATHFGLSLAQQFAPGEKRKETTLLDIIEPADVARPPTRLPSRILGSAAIGATTVAAKVQALDTHVMNQLGRHLPDHMIDKAITQYTPLGIAAAGVSYAILRSLCRKPLELRAIDASILTGAFAYSYCATAENLHMIAFAPAIVAGLGTYLGLAIGHCAITGRPLEHTPYAKTFNDMLMAIRDDRIDDALLHATQLQRDDTEYASLVEIVQLQLSIGIQQVAAWISTRVSPKNPQHDIIAGTLDLATGEHERAVQWFTRAKATASNGQRHTLRHEANLIYSLHTNDWNDTIDAILDDATLKTERLGESATTVHTIEHSPVLRQRYAIKHGPPSDINEEHEHLEKLNELERPPDCATAKLLHHSQTEDTATIVTQYVHGTLLRDQPTSENYARAAHYLGFIHAHMTREEAPRDYQTLLLNRLVEGMLPIDPRRATNILKSTFEHLDLPAYIDKDPHGENWILSHDGTLVCIDFPNKGNTSCPIQLSKLLDDHDITDTCESSNVDLRSEPIERYRQQLRDTVTHDDLLIASMYASIPVALNSAYYALQGKCNPHMTLSYLTNAARNSQTLVRRLGKPVPYLEQIMDTLNATQETLRQHQNRESHTP